MLGHGKPTPLRYIELRPIETDEVLTRAAKAMGSALPKKVS